MSEETKQSTGGKVRAERLPPEQRSRIAAEGGRARAEASGVWTLLKAREHKVLAELYGHLAHRANERFDIFADHIEGWRGPPSP